MNTCGKIAICVLLLMVVQPWAQTITATSAPFTFPPEVSVKMQKNVPHAASYFKYSGASSRTGALTFSWSFPTQPWNRKGSIVVYSLLGQSIKTIPVSMNAGAVTWHFSKESAGRVYIARIIYGSARQNLKLLMCR